MSNPIRVDFFHDVICGWCYVLSPRLHQLTKEFNLDVHHHAFALSSTREEVISKFGSMAQAKEIILGHWEQCALADDAQRINVEGMRKQKFEYPYSTPGLIACKAAQQQGGQNTYWAYFDALTHAHMSENRNIADLDILTQIAGEIGLDTAQFSKDFADPEREVEIRKDRELVQKYDISFTPTLIVDQQFKISGAVEINTLRKLFTERAKNNFRVSF